MQRILLAVLISSLGASVTVQAQQPHPVQPPSRWMLGGHSVAALGTSVGTGEPDDIKTSTGLGGGVQVGYLISRRLTAYAGLEVAKQPIDVLDFTGDFGLTHLEAGARLSFPVQKSKLLPYVGAWIGRRSMSSTVDLDDGTEADLSVSGMAVGANGGVQYFVSRNVALDGGVSVGFGKMNTFKVSGQKQAVPTFNNTTTTRLQFGANWYP
jgi:Outer membrane protein beta-barrel domain